MMNMEGKHLKKVCVDVDSVDGVIPDVELVPLTRGIGSIAEQRMRVCVRGCSPYSLRVLADSREDSRGFVAYEEFSCETFLRCFRRAFKDVFGMLETTTLLDSLAQRLETAVHEDWT